MTRRHYGFDSAPMHETCAHDGRGNIRTARVEMAPKSSVANFIDLTILPPGTSIGVHTHGPADEEIYIVISGNGRMRLDADEFSVKPGDVVVNRCGGSHGLANTGKDEIRLVVIEVAAQPKEQL